MKCPFRGARTSSTGCSHVRIQDVGRAISFRGGGLVQTVGWVRRAGDRTRRRRLNKLSCAGWVPHDRGFVLGLPHSKDERRSGDRLITAREGSPPRPCLQLCAPATLYPPAPHLVPAAMVGGT